MSQKCPARKAQVGAAAKLVEQVGIVGLGVPASSSTLLRPPAFFRLVVPERQEESSRCVFAPRGRRWRHMGSADSMSPARLRAGLLRLPAATVVFASVLTCST